MWKINSLNGYFEAQEEINDLRNFRDRVEESGGSTTNIEKRIDELVDGCDEFRSKNKDLF